MPGLDGVQAAQAIRALGLPQTPIMVIVSAFGREEVIRGAQDAGIHHLAHKPVSASNLLDTLMRASHAAQPGDVPPQLPAAQSEPTLRALRGLRGARVLLVEDNELNRQVARELLQDAGMAVDVSQNGQTLLEQADAEAAELMEQQSTLLRQLLGPQYQPLAEAVAQFDVDAAVQALQQARAMVQASLQD